MVLMNNDLVYCWKIFLTKDNIQEYFPLRNSNFVGILSKLISLLENCVKYCNILFVK